MLSITALKDHQEWDGSQYVGTFVALKKLGACTSLKTAESLFYNLIQV
jgi:hypothetical protein